jgi:hypothetical protein
LREIFQVGAAGFCCHHFADLWPPFNPSYLSSASLATPLIGELVSCLNPQSISMGSGYGDEGKVSIQRCSPTYFYSCCSLPIAEHMMFAGACLLRPQKQKIFNPSSFVGILFLIQIYETPSNREA